MLTYCRWLRSAGLAMTDTDPMPEKNLTHARDAYKQLVFYVNIGVIKRLQSGVAPR